MNKHQERTQVSFFEALLFANLGSLVLDIAFKAIVAAACLKYLFWS